MASKRKFLLRGFVIIFVALFIIGYAYLETREYLLGIRLEIVAPENGKSFSSNKALGIEGSGHNVSTLTLNGKKIFADRDGYFKENIAIAKGYNIFEVRATDRFGRKERKIIKVFGL